MEVTGGTTLGRALKLLFPKGTYGTNSIKRYPSHHASLFGAVGYLLKKSGAYHRIFPLARDENVLAEKYLDKVDRFADLGQRIHKIALPSSGELTNQDLKTLRSISSEVQSCWRELLTHSDKPLRSSSGTPEEWWYLAASLLVFSDEASRDFGYISDKEEKSELDPMVISIAEGGVLESSDERIPSAHTDIDHVHLRSGAALSFAPFLDPSLIKVLPKGRTPNVGCTFRALSHNLCLIADGEELQVSWFAHQKTVKGKYDPLNLLLVPLPFRVTAKSFAKTGVPKNKRGDKAVTGWYEINQGWIEDDSTVLDILKPLMENADELHGSVHGIVFPELALDWPSYQRIVEHVLQTWNKGRSPGDGVQFITAGVSENHKKRRGNFAFFTSFHYDEVTNSWSAKSFGRQKHHRWKLNRSQLTDYALSSVLDPDVTWWEDIDIDQRALGVHLVRDNITVCPLICEDLARSDPCHQPLKSIGPNLIIALLMDGPQIHSRWPGRYATNMADDPGSSVLSLSCLGLMERTNRTKRYTENRCVALWKDDRGETVSIELPKDSSAILLTLSATVASESTLDGRKNADAVSLQYQCHVPIRSQPKTS